MLKRSQDAVKHNLTWGLGTGSKGQSAFSSGLGASLIGGGLHVPWLSEGKALSHYGGLPELINFRGQLGFAWSSLV